MSINIKLTITAKNIKQNLRILMDCIDDYNILSPESRDLTKACRRYYLIIHDVLHIIPSLSRVSHPPFANSLYDLETNLKNTIESINEFIKHDWRKSGSILSEVGQKAQRAYSSHHLRAVFQSTTKLLEVNKEAFKESFIHIKKPAQSFRHLMVNEACYNFWEHMCEYSVLNDWSLFAKVYQWKFNESWTVDEEERIRRVACSSNSEDTSLSTPLHILEYIALTNQCGFPIEYDKVPLMPVGEEAFQIRMTVARMINEMVTYHATLKMRKLLVAIFTWYKGCNKREHAAWDARANEWAKIIKANRGKPLEKLDEGGVLAEQVDMARQAYSTFYQRYMVVFNIGRISEEMLAEVDFPGKARMVEFIEHVKPLERAYFMIVMNVDEENWESKQPKVYKFLQEHIAESKRARQTKDGNM
ncbi:unnamed protein product [Absidia cylindrospora]